jgi:plastocyanin
MKLCGLGVCILGATIFGTGHLAAQVSTSDHAVAELRLHIATAQTGKHRSVPMVVWLEPLAGTRPLQFSSAGRYTLVQKNRMFIPHLQVIPVGSVVQFPNADPFFHNVFSLFDGRRFDLGLYEAGSSKSVTFSREGVSYIFCNIHPEMSAVVLSLSTPLYAVADENESLLVRDIPPGDYKMNLWIEGVPQSILESLSRHLHLQAQPLDLGEVKVPINAMGVSPHENKFGRSYDKDPKSAYIP